MLKRWATTPSRTSPRPRHPDLHPIDVNKLAQELKLKEEAVRLGAAGIPAADAKVLSGPEAGVVQRVETYRQGYLDWAVARMNTLSSDISKLTVTAEVNRALQADKEFERKAGTLLSENEAELRPLAESAKNAQRELLMFRRKHRIERDARWPEGGTKVLLYAGVLVMVLIEGAANASMFAHGLASGWLGGMTYAGILAAINVGVAFMLGKHVVRYAVHKSGMLKLVGILAAVAALVFIVALGFAIGHFRESLMAEAQEPATAALAAFKAGPWNLHDGMSWPLAFVTWLFGVLALCDGLVVDDPYPGYGKLSRHVNQVVGDYEDEIQKLREDLEALKDEQLSLLEGVASSAQATRAQYESRIEEKKSAQFRLETALQDAANSMEALLRSFRTENEVHRNGLARPGYFDEHPPLRQLPLPDFSTETDRKALVEQTTLVGKLVDDIQGIRARIQEAFNQRYDLLKPLSTQYSSMEAK